MNRLSKTLIVLALLAFTAPLLLSLLTSLFHTLTATPAGLVALLLVFAAVSRRR